MLKLQRLRTYLQEHNSHLTSYFSRWSSPVLVYFKVTKGSNRLNYDRSYHTQFPTPTKLAMILTSIQWVTFTMTITTCVVYQVPVLISPRINTVESVTELLETYRVRTIISTLQFSIKYRKQ